MLKSLKRYRSAYFSLLELEVDDQDWLKETALYRRTVMIEALIALLVEKSIKTGLILTIDDLQWLDSETIDFINRLMRAIKNEKIIILLGYRLEFVHNFSEGSNFSELKVGPFDTGSVNEFIDLLLGTDPQLNALKLKLIENSEGNPYFIEEMVHSLYDSGRFIRRLWCY